MAEDVKSRVSYIEPSNIAFYADGAKAIVPSNELVLSPLEEYCIAIDLEVMIPNRKACSLAKENGDYIKMNFSSTNGTLSFLHGTSGAFTTNFTDINVVNPDGNTSECLGIESIDIDYSAWQSPQVTIKFVDIRGGSVMLPEEKDLWDNAGGSVYRALFTLPSPMFKLTVKGFYGKGVTYYLCEKSVDIELDSSSGDFMIVASFIGMMFRVYADIPMTYICAAPFMDGGSQYWEEMILSKKFMFNNRSGTQTEMCVFPELKRRLANAAKSHDKLDADSKIQQTTESNKERIGELRAIRDMYPLNEWFDAQDGYYFKTSTDTTRAQIAENIKNFFDRVKKYDEAYETNYTEKFKELEPYTSANKINEYLFTVTENAEKERLLNKSGLEKIEGKDDVINYVKSSNLGAVKLFEIPVVGDTLGRQFVYKMFNDEIKKCNDAARKQLAEYKAQADAAVEEALGFTPSIENIYNLAFAHMDTFMHVFYEHMDVIKKKLDDNDPERMKESYGFTSEDSDIPNKEYQVPPYPAFYEDINSISDGKEERRRQLLWLEDVPGGYKLDETYFVKNLLKASEMYFRLSSDIDRDIAQNENVPLKEGNRKTGGTGDADNLKGAPSTAINSLVPVTIYDFVNKDKAQNPYSWVKNGDEKSSFSDASEFEDAIMGSFALRAMHYLSVNDGKRDAETFGKLEALNFIKEFGDAYYSEKFYDFIEKYADGDGERSEAKDIISRLTSRDCIWGNIISGGTLLKKSGGKLEFNASRDHLYFPIGRTSATEMKKDMNSGNSLASNVRYIPEDSKSDKLLSKNDTFFYFENSRDYVNEVYKNIDSFIGSGDYGIDKSRVEEFKNNIDNITDRKKDVRYRNDCIFDENNKDVGGNSIYDLLNTSTQNMSTYWIKHPTCVNEGWVLGKDSLFDEDYYKWQKSTISKAYLFIMSIPIKSNRQSGVGAGNIPLDCENGVDLKSQLLREGALHWRKAEIGKSGADPIITKSGNKEYKSASADELYMHNPMITINSSTGNSKETIAMLPKDDRRNYFKWNEPKGTTASRKEVLIGLFENWAEKEFGKVEPFLSNEAYYVDNKFKKGINHDLVKAGGSLQGNAQALDAFLRSTYFKVSSIFDYYAGRREGQTKFTADADELRTAYRGFMSVLSKVYKKQVKQGREATSHDAAVRQSEDPFNNTDLRLSTYMTIKNLYDQWFCAPFKGRKTWDFTDEESDFKSFSYIDSYYHDIGKTLMVNITKVSEWISNCMPSQNIESAEGIMKYTGRSLYQYLCDIAQNTGGMLIAFPQRIGGSSVDHLAEMFRVYPFCSNWYTDESSYVFIYTYKPSEHLGNDNYEDDGMDLRTKQVRSLLSDEGYQIPAFGVTYAKQNQAFFKNITLNTNSPAVTEVSIQATMNIASKGSEGARETSLFGQDIYRIKSSYAYQCEFDMMGCMQVVPLMYFQLNNVPFWRGGYVIYGVKHSITAGDMVTHVSGQRLSKFAIPLTDGVMTGDKVPPDSSSEMHSGAGGDGSAIGSGGNYGIQALGYGSQNDEPGDPNKQKENITEDKPLICLWPAHSQSGEKGSEWYWSQKLIDQYIIPKLSKLNFHDGTSYADNIYRANKTGGYSGNEVRGLISTYGSKKVISVVPHWNAARGNYFIAFKGKQRCNKIDKGDGKRHWGDCRDEVMRGDSFVLASMFNEEVEKVSARGNNHEFRVMPEGMMKGGVKTGKTDGLLPYNDESVLDPAVNLNCACVLTENFFVDYGQTDSDKDTIAGGYEAIERNKAKYTKKTADGRYKFGQGWLLSDEGMTVISNYHVEAIRRYINNLHNGIGAMTTVGGSSSSSSNEIEDIYVECANIIGCEVAAFKAVKQVESGNRRGFIAPGKPSILFEGHIFWNQLSKRGKNPSDYVNGNRDILYPSWTKNYYKGGIAEYERLERAKAIDEEAALASASWGMFQVMGFNYASCGYGSVKDFVNTLCTSEEAQIRAAAQFISRNKDMRNALIRKDWKTFAYYYNGPGYAKNRYDEKLEKAYQNLK